VEGLRERKKQRTREAIVTVSLELFAERGYQQTTVAEIAEAAEVSKGTVFAYFPTKEDIVFADTAPVCDDLLRRLRDRPQDRSAVDVLRSFIGDHIIAPDERRLLRERLIAGDEQLRSHYRARLAEIEDAMAAAIAGDLGTAPDDLRPRLAAATVMAALAAAKDHARRVRGQAASLEEVAAVLDEAVAFLEAGLDAMSQAGAR
jgi:AcrR family transcriptional regulator